MESYNNFKTSHVKVNRCCRWSLTTPRPYFKTSHVKVNQSAILVFCTSIFISKHPMLKLIVAETHESVKLVHFKTSHVKVNQRISCIPYNTLYQIPQYLSTFLKFLPATAPFAKKIYKITAMPLFLRIHAILH